jgi:4-carboxymuconolactone decarboxylase
MKHGRLPWLSPEALSKPQRDLYDRIVEGPRSQGRRAFPLADDDGRLHGPFNAMLLNPEIGMALQELGAAIRYRSTLPDRAREIAILELAVQRRCAFEWYAHERVGRNVGLTDDELAALRMGKPAPTFDRVETAARGVVRLLLEQRDLDDERFSEARTALGETMLMELVVLAGYYDLLALSLRVWRTPLPGGAESPF